MNGCAPRSWCAGALVLAALAAREPGQSAAAAADARPPAPQASQHPSSQHQAAERQCSLHQAWLREVLDLDEAGAIAGYEQVARDLHPGNLERWIATARLIELHRLGVAGADPVRPNDVPTALRSVFGAAQAELPMDELLHRAQGDPSVVLQAVTSEAGKLPALRPAVPTAEEWLLGQIGPSLRDRVRQRMEENLVRGRSPEATRFFERLYAADIVRAEIEGRTTQANALRTLHFADWRPPATPGDPAPHLARFHANLEAWLAEDGLSASEQTLLRDLREAIDQRAATDPAGALAMIVKLPTYAKRLLAEPTPR
ncbi:MAG TPA: hypothetical protein VFZ65_09635 [Planctomycetota bacterium]|nr:hypothetical protein [Planctomycetota bacterium]